MLRITKPEERPQKIEFKLLPQPPYIFCMVEAGMIRYAEELLDCILDKNRDKEDLYEWTKPFISMLVHQFKNPGCEKEINFIIVSRRVADRFDPVQAVEHWVKRIEETHTVEEELWMLFLTSLDKIEHMPRRRMPRRIERTVIKQFRSDLKNSIRYHATKPLQQYCNEDMRIEMPEKIPDPYLKKNIDLTTREEYVLNLLYSGMRIQDIAKQTKTTKQTLEKELTYLCKLQRLANSKPLPK